MHLPKESKFFNQYATIKETVLTPPSDTWGICLNKKYGFISLQEVHATSLEKCRGEPPLFQKQVS